MVSAPALASPITFGREERARALVAKKMRSMHGLDATVQTRRLAGMLARKGYSSSVSWSVIREAIADPLNQIVSAIKIALEQTPPELGADIAEHCPPGSFENTVVVVRCDSTAWATQL